MFALCARGLGPSKIARILKQEQIVIPTVYNYRQAGTGHAHLNLDKPYEWSSKNFVLQEQKAAEKSTGKLVAV